MTLTLVFIFFALKAWQLTRCNVELICFPPTAEQINEIIDWRCYSDLLFDWGWYLAGLFWHSGSDHDVFSFPWPCLSWEERRGEETATLTLSFDRYGRQSTDTWSGGDRTRERRWVMIQEEVRREWQRGRETEHPALLRNIRSLNKLGFCPIKIIPVDNTKSFNTKMTWISLTSLSAGSSLSLCCLNSAGAHHIFFL